MATKNERKIIRKSLLYELRLMLTNNNKETYTANELCTILDTLAAAEEKISKISSKPSDIFAE